MFRLLRVGCILVAGNVAGSGDAHRLRMYLILHSLFIIEMKLSINNSGRK